MFAAHARCQPYRSSASRAIDSLHAYGFLNVGATADIAVDVLMTQPRVLTHV